MQRDTQILIGIGAASILMGVGAIVVISHTPGAYRDRVIQAIERERPAPDQRKYWQEVSGGTAMLGKAWCGALALYALHQAGLGKDIPWIDGRGFLFRLNQTNTPKRGDIAYYEHLQHHAVVKSVNPDGTVTTYDGNDVGGSIGEHVKQFNSATNYYSIDSLIKAA